MMAKTATKTKKATDIRITGFVNEKDNNIVTPKGRMMFTAVARKFVRKGDDAEKGKYGVELAFPPEADLSILDAAAVEAAKEEGWTVETFLDGDVRVKHKGKTVKLHSPFLNSEELYSEESHTSKGEEVDWSGFVTIRCNTKNKPEVRNSQGEEIEDDDLDIEVYSGRWARLMVRCYAYDVDGNAGVSIGLESVQLLSKDDKTSKFGSASGENFGAVDDEDEDADV